MVRRIAVVVAFGSLVACSLLTDFGGLSGPVAEAEGGPPLDGATNPDAQPDVTSDASVADAPPPRFCATSTHTFCADFDDANPLVAFKRETDPIAQLEVSSARARSLPSSLFTMMPRRAAGSADALGVVGKHFDGSWRRIVLELDLYLERPDWAAGDVNSALVSIELYSATSNAGFYVVSGETYTNVNDTSGQAMPTDQWVHVKIDLDPAGSIAAKIGSVSYATTFAAKIAGASPTMLVRLGVNGFNAPAPRYAVSYDNVTVDLP